MYRSSFLIEAYDSPGKYWLALHLFNEGAIFCCEASRWWNERHVLQMYSAASRSHSFAMDRRRVARLTWGITWTFTYKTLQIETASEFKSGKYGSQSARVQNSSRTCGRSWQFGMVINPLEDVFSIRIHPMDLGDLGDSSLKRFW